MAKRRGFLCRPLSNNSVFKESGIRKNVQDIRILKEKQDTKYYIKEINIFPHIERNTRRNQTKKL